ncbi:hypothetical protein ONS95_012684 [Cadophora gregata]|uniref:uncharacterized protein n=1 Tax=Cadophora gregata TaxID=51156 RepID=UPI0026DD192B|nr:uncharacterized protein ONS95_012684 [Cadophora gregata]KAK0118395.1 hypothetical protein ONS95_012684 [Cadophora gregata]
MPPLPGFSDNPLLTHSDLTTAVYSLLNPLTKHQSPNGARIRLPISTATHFDETAAQLEGFARPLWAIGALLAYQSPGEKIDPRLEGWIKGFAVGCDPSDGNEEYWGDVQDMDQRMVEVEILAYALLAAPVAFLGPEGSKDPFDVKRRADITRYLQSVNGKRFPQTNWLWFRVMANLALVKSCGVPYEEVKGSMDADLKVLDGFYVGEGWASDGVWVGEGKEEGGRQMDYYSGSFAIQFSQLCYVKYARDLDPERVEIFEKRARDFAVAFWRYFDAEGASIPFGRSLTYRFAMGGFWAAVTMAEVSLPAPLTPGVVKGLLLRHLRYWASKPDIFYADGTLNIGFCYPNMYMSEDYNSPQSPYWCMKTFCMLALPASHEFWKIKEEPLPSSTAKGGIEVALLEQPQQILVDSGNHHFLLSSGQYCAWPLKATEAKYAKFAYSSSFGFSVPTGPLIQQISLDSTLALSEDGGESWRVRWKSEQTRIESVDFLGLSKGQNEKIPVLLSRWKSSRASGLQVKTTLIPPTRRWPDWHIRVHEIVVKKSSEVGVLTVEGGFAIYGRKRKDGLALLPLNWQTDNIPPNEISSEGINDSVSSALVVSSAGASGIRNLAYSSTAGKLEINGEVLKPDANTNLMVSRTLIPTLKASIMPEEAGTEFLIKLVTAVFAVGAGKLDAGEIHRRWEDAPKVGNREDAGKDGDLILL